MHIYHMLTCCGVSDEIVSATDPWYIYTVPDPLPNGAPIATSIYNIYSNYQDTKSFTLVKLYYIIIIIMQNL